MCKFSFNQVGRPANLLQGLVARGVEVDARAVGAISALDIARHLSDAEAIQILTQDDGEVPDSGPPAKRPSLQPS